MAMKLTRDATLGRILANGQPITLKGGHFHLFLGEGAPIKGYYKPQTNIPFSSEVDLKTCPYPQVNASPKYWDNSPWSALFTKLTSTQCNLIRIWLTNGSYVDASGKPTDYTPFLSVLVNNKWKWKVREAVETNQWNNAYFARLKDFVSRANDKGIAVQISLFNYADLHHFGNGPDQLWPISFYNPLNCNGNIEWAKAHLVYKYDPQIKKDILAHVDEKGPRHKFFINPDNSLRIVQKALVNKVVDTLQGYNNVILEVMNEPRAESKPVSVEFSSKVMEWVLTRAATHNWRPLLSMNCSLIDLDTKDNLQKGDYEWWTNNHPTDSIYDELDIVSYHSLTGFDLLYQKFICENETNPVVDRAYPMSCTDKQSISKRIVQFRQNDHHKALMFSTDAVKPGPARFLVKNAEGNAELDTYLEFRDGQFHSAYVNNYENPSEQRLFGDLQNWAAWIFQSAKSNPGLYHFQNHSFNEVTFDRIKAAWDNPL